MRTERFKDLLPVDRLRAAQCSVIGVGAIGRQVALQLAAMGVGRLHLVDFDVVEEINLGPQGYLAEDVGQRKVEATASLARRLNPELLVDACAERFAKSMGLAPIVFCCVDSIQTRRTVFEAVKDRSECFVDGRMAAEVLRVITAYDAVTRHRYSATLFDPSQAHRDGCTARSTVYCANIAAGVMLGQFTKWLRQLKPDFDITFNIFSAELSVS